MYWRRKEQLKELKEKYFYYINHHDEAEKYFNRDWESIRKKAEYLGLTSSKINKECTRFLGEHISERVLIHVFKDVKRMPVNNPGFDFICNKGMKIDVKSSCLSIKTNKYMFIIDRNKTADYFLLIGFDNRKDLNPQHIWLIKGDVDRKINTFMGLSISNSKHSLSKYSKYELTDKLKDVISCCDMLKNKIEV